MGDEASTVSNAIALVSAIGAVLAAIFAGRQAILAKRQALAAEEQADLATRQAAAAEQQAAAAKVQADLAKAQLGQIKQSEDTADAHRRWLDGALLSLRQPTGKGPLRVAPGEKMHADWAIAHGYVEEISTSLGQAVQLPAAERLTVPGSHEAKLLAKEKELLEHCALNPGAWTGLARAYETTEEWNLIVEAAQQLELRDFLNIRASPDGSLMSVLITTRGSEAVRAGSF